MDILGNIGAGLAQSILSNPAMLSLLSGVIVKVVVDKLKEQLKLVDANGIPEDKKGLVQQLVLACSFLVTLGEAALKGQLALLDPSQAVQFIVNLVTTQLVAQGTNSAVKAVKK